MPNVLVSLADRWISRRATPDARARAAVNGLEPAVVITGGSRGIGRALAMRFAEAGHSVVLIAREAAPLQAAANEISSSTGVRAVSIALDVTLADAPRLIDEALAANGLYADILVNNAGVGLSGHFSDHRSHDLERLVSLNVAAATRLMHHALAPMLARAHGGILNVASLGGMVPGPFQATYYASKAYLISLTEAVAHEARGRGVRISVIAPGPVDTTFHSAMKADRALYRTAFPGMAPAAVASSAYRGFMMGRTVIVPGVLPTASAVALKILPHAVSVPIVAALLSFEDRTPRDP